MLLERHVRSATYSEPTEGGPYCKSAFARRAGAASRNDPTGSFRDRIRPLSSIHSRRLATRRCSFLSRRRSIHPCCLGGGARGEISRRTRNVTDHSSACESDEGGKEHHRSPRCRSGRSPGLHRTG